MFGAETARRPVVERRIGGAQAAMPKRQRRNSPLLNMVLGPKHHIVNSSLAIVQFDVWLEAP